MWPCSGLNTVVCVFTERQTYVYHHKAKQNNGACSKSHFSSYLCDWSCYRYQSELAVCDNCMQTVRNVAVWRTPVTRFASWAAVKFYQTGYLSKNRKNSNSLGIAVLTVKAIGFNSAVTFTMKTAILSGLYMLQPHGIFLWVFIQMISSYQTAMTEIYTLKSLRSLSSRQKNNKTKPNKQGKYKLKLCDLPLCTQSGRWHAFHILFERVPTSPNVDDRTHGGPKWEAGFYMGQRQEDYGGQINGGSREAGILTWNASRRTHGATCI